MNIIKFSLLFTIAVLPLVDSFFGFGYEHIKVVFFVLMVSLSSFFWLIYSTKDPSIKIKRSKLQFLSALFLLFLLLSSLLGINPQSSFFGNPPYYQGLFLYLTLFLFFLIVSSVKIDFVKYSWAVTLPAIFVSFFAIKDFLLLNIFHQMIPNFAGRVVTTFGQPNLYSGFLLLCLPFIYFLISKGKNLNYLQLTASALSGMAILVSKSRSAILILGLLLFVIFLSKVSRYKYIIVVCAFLLLIISVYISFNLQTGLFFKELIEPRTNQWLVDNSPEKRTFIWQVAGELILKRPIFGYGLENINQAFTFYLNSFDLNSNKLSYVYSLKEVVIDRSHSYILDLWLYSGVLTLFIWIGLLLYSFKNTQNIYLKSFLLIYLVWTSIQVQSVVHLVYFWFVLGIINREVIDKASRTRLL